MAERIMTRQRLWDKFHGLGSVSDPNKCCTMEDAKLLLGLSHYLGGTFTFSSDPDNKLITDSDTTEQSSIGGSKQIVIKNIPSLYIAIALFNGGDAPIPNSSYSYVSLSISDNREVTFYYNDSSSLKLNTANGQMVSYSNGFSIYGKTVFRNILDLVKNRYIVY